LAHAGWLAVDGFDGDSIMTDHMIEQEMDKEDLYFYLQKRFPDMYSLEDLDKLTEEVWKRMHPEGTVA